MSTAYQQSKTQHTDRSIPLMAGLFGLQAVNKSPSGPDVAFYRMSAKDAVAWMNRFVIADRFSKFLMLHGERAWDVHDENGVFVEKSENPAPNALREPVDPIDVDRDRLLTEAREILEDDDLSLIACSEGHGGANMAERSNFTTCAKRFIIDAKPDDLEKVFLVDSRLYDCRVLGLYANVQSFSPEMQDRFLDYYRWLKNGWPLSKEHHADMLADRLSRDSSDYVLGVMSHAARSSGWQEMHIHGMYTKWSLSTTSAKYRFCQNLVRILYDTLLFEAQKPEEFDLDRIQEFSDQVVEAYTSVMR